MAKFVKSFIGQIGGLTSRMAGGDFFDDTDPAGKRDEAMREDGCDGAPNTRAKSQLDSSSKSLSSEEDPDSHSGNGENDSPVSEYPVAVKRGYLSKWTNYLHGWQDRYVAVANGIMSYYKSEYDTQYGCRGSISLHLVKVLLHEFDELRFDIRVHDCTYFFRASSVEEKLHWVETVEDNKKCYPEIGLSTKIKRQGSILSLSGISMASTSSFKVGHDFQTKLSEIETFRDLLCRQVDTLQAYFDYLAETNPSGRPSADSLQHSSESFTRVPEEDDGTSEPAQPLIITSVPSSPLIRPPDHTHLHHNPPHTSPNTSPLTHQRTLQAQGHRRTGSDPFSFSKRIGHQHGNYYSHAKVAKVGGVHNGPINVSNTDFHGEAITFKATTAGMLATLSHCIDMLGKREEYWQKKYEKEVEKRRKADHAAHAALNGPRVMAYQYAGPDFEEGPYSVLKEEEFFDALEITYQQEELGRQRTEEDLPETATEVHVLTGDRASEEGPVQEASCLEDIQHKSITGLTHRMTSMVDEKVTQYARYIFESVGTNWSVIYEDGDLKVYRRELEEGGVVVDPLKSFYVAANVSAREVSNYFFDFDTRLEWEGTIEAGKIVETLAEDTIIFHHLHKRVWPSTQRETVFCSHICTLPNAPRAENQVGHTWMVCNFSVDDNNIPVNSKLIRATFQIGLVCQTVAKQPTERGKEAELGREDISCKIIYATNVNPGGWAPPSVVRTIGKREITKFLRKFSSTVQKRTATSPLTL